MTGTPHIHIKTHIPRTSAVAIAVASVVASGMWMQTHPVSAACTAPTKSYGTAAFTVDVPATGSYQLWSRIMAPDTTNNDYMMEVDGGSCYIVGNSAITPNTWTWVDYQNATTTSKITASLAAGKHTIKFIGSEPSVKVDRVLAVANTACVPIDTGDNCAVVSDTTAPTVTVGTPADGVTVQGTVAATATASDNKAVVKVEFYINGVLKSTVTTAPYTYSWNTTGLANGSYAVMVKAYDAAGNVGSDTNTVRIGNGDTTAPTVPANVKAVASAYNKVTITWSASTDASGVTAYVITRNGLPLETVGTSTSYTDATTTPNTPYTYKVSARDAAGNTSAAGSAASVTTPSAPDTQAPSIPNAVTAVASGASQVNVTWSASTDNTGVIGYDVYRVSGPDSLKVATVTATQFGDTGLKASTSYGYYIIAKDANGNKSDQSLTATATTASQPVTPPADAATGVVRGKVTGSHRRALADVKIVLTSGDKRYQATTNNDGVYRLENIPAGRYRIQYKVTGYQTEEDSLRMRSSKDVVINNVRLTAKGDHQNWWDRWF